MLMPLFLNKRVFFVLFPNALNATSTHSIPRGEVRRSRGGALFGANFVLSCWCLSAFYDGAVDRACGW